MKTQKGYLAINGIMWFMVVLAIGTNIDMFSFGFLGTVAMFLGIATFLYLAIGSFMLREELKNETKK